MFFANHDEMKNFLKAHEFTVYSDNGVQLNSCKAWICDCYIVINNERHYFKALKSYNTIVAIASKGCCYFLGYWSNTTTQHCYKFAKVMECDMIYYLYNRKDRIVMLDKYDGKTTKEMGIMFYV